MTRPYMTTTQLVICLLAVIIADVTGDYYFDHKEIQIAGDQ